MPTASIRTYVSIGGTAFAFVSTVERSADGQISQSVNLPAGKAGAVDGSAGIDGLQIGRASCRERV
jgi:hypothetical protein